MASYTRLDPNPSNASVSQYKKKLNGWLSYAFASEVFVIVSLTLFLPICLEQFARDNGYLLPEKTQPCSSLQTAPPISKNGTAGEVGVDELEAARCVVKIAWAWIDTASFSLYVYSISVALQALTVISMGGIADHPPHRKLLLLSFAAMGSIAASFFLLLPSSSPVWILSALLAMSANVGFGASTVAMNSYIPSLAKEAPEVVKILTDLQNLSDVANAEPDIDPDSSLDSENDINNNPNAPLLRSNTSTPRALDPTTQAKKTQLENDYQAELSRTTARISSFGIAIGYGAGIGMLIVALVPVTMLKGTTFALRLAIGLSGIWWALFTLPAALWLPSGKGAVSAPALSLNGGRRNARREEESLDVDDKNWSFWREVGAAWIRLGNMLRWREIKRLRNTFKFLAAWFLLSDGFTTITSTAILFGKTTLHMSPSALILVGILTPSSGILGSLVWPAIQRRLKWSNLKILVVLVCMASVIPVYGCIGFVVQGRARFGGLTTQGEMFGLAVYFGSVYGAFQGYARAFYAELLPPGEEARWYGLFSITDKSSSFIGPLVVGIISDLTGNIRYSFFFLVFMIWLAVPILTCVDVDRGRKDAQEYEYRAGGGSDDSRAS